jgi:hypothetical protein
VQAATDRDAKAGVGGVELLLQGALHRAAAAAGPEGGHAHAAAHKTFDFEAFGQLVLHCDQQQQQQPSAQMLLPLHAWGVLLRATSRASRGACDSVTVTAVIVV